MFIKDFSYTIPTIGRIAIGEKVESNGKNLPKKLDEFVITAQHKRNGQWVPHPITQQVLKSTGQEKLREIPVALMFNDPDLSLRERYEAFDHMGRMLCAGDGEKARRASDSGIREVDCVGPDQCQFGKDARCRLMTRFNVQIDVPVEEGTPRPDPMSSFILRSAGFNTARTLRTKLKATAALLGGNLLGVPFTLKLRQKSSAMSRQSIFYYVDLVLREDLQTSARMAKETAARISELGLDQAAFEEAIREGLRNGPFEDTTEDFAEAAEYLRDPAPEGTGQSTDGGGAPEEGADGSGDILDADETAAKVGLEALREVIEQAEIAA